MKIVTQMADKVSQSQNHSMRPVAPTVHSIMSIEPQQLNAERRRRRQS